MSSLANLPIAQARLITKDRPKRSSRSLVKTGRRPPAGVSVVVPLQKNNRQIGPDSSLVR
jgi:hypothetical protein